MMKMRAERRQSEGRGAAATSFCLWFHLDCGSVAGERSLDVIASMCTAAPQIAACSSSLHQIAPSGNRATRAATRPELVRQRVDPVQRGQDLWMNTRQPGMGWCLEFHSLFAASPQRMQRGLRRPPSNPSAVNVSANEPRPRTSNPLVWCIWSGARHLRPWSSSIDISTKEWPRSNGRALSRCIFRPPTWSAPRPGSIWVTISSGWQFE